MGLKKNNPGCGCCDETGGCEECIDGDVPVSVTVEITGIANGSTCSSCALLNGTYVLAPNWQSQVCWYHYSLDVDDICPYSPNPLLNLGVQFNAWQVSGTRVYGWVGLAYTFGEYTEGRDFQGADVSPGKIDCTNLDEDLSAKSTATGTLCTWSSVTCHVSV